MLHATQRSDSEAILTIKSDRDLSGEFFENSMVRNCSESVIMML